MKRILFILVWLLFVPTFSHAWTTMGIGQPVAAGCTKGATIFADDFEDVADGTELSNYGNWSESGAVADVVGDNAVVNAGGSTLSVIFGSATNTIYIYNTFSEITSGKTTFEYYNNWDVVNVTINNMRIRDGGTDIVRFNMTSAGDLQIYDNDGYIDIFTGMSEDTWYKIEVEIDTDISTGINAVRVWLDGVESSASSGDGFDTLSRGDPSGIDTAGFYTDSSDEYWVDDYLHYTGARCEN
jgi:hypothetical protein